MRQIATLLLSLLTLLPQQTAAQALPYDFNFEEVELTPPEEDGDRLLGLSVSQSPRNEARGRTYGPFRVMDASHAAMAGVTDSRTPAAFSAMMRDYPGIATLEMIDCPGTENDFANLRLGRMIHARGIATYVPEGGWVASGAVELFLAGREHGAAPSARFAVHSWEDDSGRGPNDYAPNSPRNRVYLDYYRAMGMSESEARAFYAMTNSAPFSRPQFLTANDMARWIHQDGPTMRSQIRFAQASMPGRGEL